MAWPAIAQPTFTTGGEVYRPQIRTEFEGNYVQARPRTTRATRRWTLVWQNMSEADYQTFETYFVAQAGLTDTWTEPITSTSYTFRFASDRLQWSHSNLGHRAVSVDIETI